MSIVREKPEYVLGHSNDELKRLEHQGDYLSGVTRDLLIRAGIEPGMRVLDFGSGAGDVSFLVSELVGSQGEVVAIDKASDAIEHARFRMRNRKVNNIRLVQGDESVIADITGEKKFDAVVGRLVLVHSRDINDTLSRLVNCVRPGGVVAFHEIDIEGGCWSSQPLPLFERIYHLICQTFMAGGVPRNMGACLSQAFDRVGICQKRIVREGLIDTGEDSQAYEFLSRVVQTLLPIMVRIGLASESEIDIQTLADRLNTEAVAAQAYFTPVYLVAAFGRTQE